MPKSISVVMLGATGAVGNHAALALAQMPGLQGLTLLGRRPAANVVGKTVKQATIDIFAPASYTPLMAGHDAAICTLGVGQPSKMDKAEFVRTDRDAVLSFATHCKAAGVRHFELLSSVGASASSSSFYLRTKGELNDGLKALKFERLSLFQPSMIVTPQNRYGATQAVMLFAMPLLDPLLLGSMNKFRSIDVQKLGEAMANNLLLEKTGVEALHWRDIMALA